STTPGEARSITSSTGRSAARLLRPALRYCAAVTTATKWSAGTRPARYAVSGSLTTEDMPQQAPDIVGRGEDHDGDQHHEADLGEPQAQLERQRPAPHPFRQEKHQLAAVQNRNRQDVQDGQVDGQERHEPEKRRRPDPRRLARDLSDQDRSTELPERRPARDELRQEIEDHAAAGSRLRPPHADRSQDAGPGERRVRRADAHEPDDLAPLGHGIRFLAAIRRSTPGAVTGAPRYLDRDRALGIAAGHTREVLP